MYTSALTTAAGLIPGTTGISNSSGHKALSILGTLQVDGGYLSTRNSAGIILWAGASATVTINGGIVDAATFRNSNTGDGITSFIMTGGYLFIRGNEQPTETINPYGTSISFTANPDGGGEVSGNNPVFGLVDPNSVFQMSGGTIFINDVSGDNNFNSNGIALLPDVANHNVTGGTIHIKVDGNTNFDLISNGALYNLEISRLNSSNTVQVFMGSDLTLKGDLTVNSNTELIARREWGSFNGPAYDLQVARTFTVNSGADYRPRGNTTTLLTTYTTSLAMRNTNQEFFNLTIKENPNVSSTQKQFTGSNGAVTVHNNFRVESGVFNFSNSNKDLLVKGNVYNAGTITTDAAADTGAVVLANRGIVTAITLNNAGNHTSIPTITLSGGGGTGATALPVFSGVPAAGDALPLTGIIVTNSGSGYTSAPTVTISSGGATATAVINTGHDIAGDGTGIFANLEINEPHPATVSDITTSLSANITVTGMLSLTDGILDLTTYQLTLDGTLASEIVTDYSETNLFRVDGNHGDGGLNRYISTNGTYLYPLGTYNSTDAANRYAWAKPTISAFADDGYLTINNGPRKLPTLTEPSDPNDNKYLAYYWRLRNSGFTTLPQVTNQFMSYQDDYTENNINPFEIGKIVGMARYSHTDDNLGDLDQDNPSNDFHILDYNVVKPLEEGEFTAGHKNLFQGSIQVFYSRLSGVDFVAGADWQNGNNWSFTPHNATFNINSRPAAGDFPGPGDIAVIGYGDHGTGFNNGSDGIHVMGTGNNTIEVAEIRFNDTAGIWDPRVVIEPNATITGGLITGEGTLYFNMTPGNYGTIESDVSEFAGISRNTFNFKMTTNGDYAVPAYTPTYPRVRFEAGDSNGGLTSRRAYFTADAEITGDLRIDQGAIFEVRTPTTIVDEIRVGDAGSTGSLQFSETVATTIEAGHLWQRNRGDNSVLVSGANNLEHRMIINGSITQTNGSIDLFTNTTGGNNVILELGSTTSDDSLYVAAGSVPSLYQLDVNLGATQSNSFTVESNISIGGPTNGNSEDKALHLENGTLILDHPDIDITLSSGGEDFYIPASAGLYMNQGIARVTTAGSNGIFLDGLLEIRASGANQGQVILDGGPGSDNYLMYSSSGNAQLTVAEGKLTVGSQLRSSTLNKQGVLDFMMTNNGSNSTTTTEVLVGLRAAPENTRGVFEIMNPGSRFRLFNGELTIIRGHDTPGTRAAVYLDPESATLYDWGFIQFGDPVNNAGGGTQTLNTTAELGRVDIAGNTTVQLQTNDVTINGDFNIAAGSALDGNNLNLTLTDDFTNAGTEALNTDSLIFSGSSQSINGNFSTAHLVVNPSSSLTLTGSTTQITATGNLYLNAGTLNDGGKTILVQGNVTNNATHSSSGTGRIKMAATALQYLSGNGHLGNLELDNASGLHMEGDQSLNGDLYLTNGVFNIQNNSLELATASTIVGSNFSNTKMIATDGSFGDKGLKKNIPAGPYTFTYPVGIISGTDNKYTPVHFDITASNNAGSIAVHPVNQAHITTTGTDVLQYYWDLQSSGLNGFEATMAMKYLDADVVGTETDYISAWLSGDSWAKFPVETVFEAEDSIEFGFAGVADISGDYTAGIDAHIPADIPVFTSIASGNWSDAATWTRNDGLPVPVGGPNGFIVNIASGHTVLMDRFRILSYRTDIEGRLEVGTEVGHNLGTLSGTGTLALTSNKLPVGDYATFFSCTGGAAEYGGNASYTISDVYDTYRKMVISGIGTKTFNGPYNRYFCDTLMIKSGASLSNLYMIRLYGEFILEPTASFNAGARWVMALGSDIQNIEGGFNATSDFRTLSVSNSAGINMYSPVDVSGDLRLVNGIINNTGLLRHTSSSRPVLPETGASNAFVAGTFARLLESSTETKYFAIGKNNLWKPLALVAPQNPATASYWTAEYFANNPGDDGYNPTSYDAPLTQVSLVEYWTLGGPVGGTAKLQLPLKGISDVAAITPVLSDLRVVRWNATSSKWEIVGGDANMTVTGTAADGTVTTSATITMDGSTGIYTLGTTESTIVPTIQFTTTAMDACQGSTVNLTVALTGDPAVTSYTFTFEDNLGNTFNKTVNPAAASYTFSVSPAATRTYTLTAVADNNATAGIIYGNPAVVTAYPNPTAYSVGGTGNYCASEAIAVTLSNSQTGYNYELFVDGVTTGRILGGTNGSPLSFGSIATGGVYTIEATNSANTSCTSIMTGTANITIIPAPAATLALAVAGNDTLCEGNLFQLTLTITGTAPWDVTYTDGTTNWTVSGITSSPHVFDVNEAPKWIDPGTPLTPRQMTYQVVDVTSGTCTTTPAGSVDVWIFKQPETGPAYHIPNEWE